MASTTAESDRRRVVFEFTIDDLSAYDELARETGEVSRAGLFRRALRVYAQLWAASRSGTRVVFRASDGSEETQQFFPGLTTSTLLRQGR